MYVLQMPPLDRAELEIWTRYHRKVLKTEPSPSCTLIEITHEEHDIDRVIDLRLPKVQRWFFQRFAVGESPWLTKFAGEHLHDFLDLLPTLMDPKYGGTGATQGIGSWMSANRVDAFIFPSARSDAAVRVRDGELVGFHGWNLMDYRGALEIEVSEALVDEEPWHGFLQPDVHLTHSLSGTPAEGSWAAVGIEHSYDSNPGTYEDIIERVLPRSARAVGEQSQHPADDRPSDPAPEHQRRRTGELGLAALSLKESGSSGGSARRSRADAS